MNSNSSRLEISLSIIFNSSEKYTGNGWCYDIILSQRPKCLNKKYLVIICLFSNNYSALISLPASTIHNLLALSHAIG